MNGSFHREWWVDGLLHRSGDRPARIRFTGIHEWFARGYHHRDGGKPAVIWPDGALEWKVHGRRHRAENKSAIMRTTGYQEWWADGFFLHRHQVTDFRDDGARCLFVIAVLMSANA